jgi:hypothetical protein
MRPSTTPSQIQQKDNILLSPLISLRCPPRPAPANPTADDLITAAVQHAARIDDALAVIAESAEAIERARHQLRKLGAGQIVNRLAASEAGIWQRAAIHARVARLFGMASGGKGESLQDAAAGVLKAAARSIPKPTRSAA